jgi:hypothetical protein
MIGLSLSAGAFIDKGSPSGPGKGISFNGFKRVFRVFPLNHPSFYVMLKGRMGDKMTVAEAVKLLDGQFFYGEDKADMEIVSACGADLMSDVMAFVKDRVLLLTGLVNPQVIRTAELLDIRCIIFVRGKNPSRDMIDMAEEADIILSGTKLPMFLACGKLYEAGLKTGGTRRI